MRKYYTILTFCLISLLVYAQHAITREQFYYNIKHSFRDPATVTLMEAGARLYPDTVYRLPPPLYKASAVMESKAKDTFLFYYYPKQYFDSVLHTCLHTQWNVNDLRYHTLLPLNDSSSRFFLVYFFRAVYDSAQTTQIDKDIMAAFKMLPTKFTVTVQSEEEYNEPPPPPPPARSSGRKPAKKKNPA